jgi:chromosome segregation ATPase
MTASKQHTVSDIVEKMTADNSADPVSRTAIEFISKRQDRIEDILDRVTTIQEELSKTVATNTQQILDSARQIEKLASMHDDTRGILDARLDSFNTRIDSVRTELTAMLEKNYQILNEKFERLSTVVWRIVGASSLVVVIIAYGPMIYKTLTGH